MPDCSPLWNSASPKDSLGNQEVHGIDLASVMSEVGFTESRASLKTDFTEMNDLPMGWAVVGDGRARVLMVSTARLPRVCDPCPPEFQRLRLRGGSRFAAMFEYPLASRHLPAPSAPDLPW